MTSRKRTMVISFAVAALMMTVIVFAALRSTKTVPSTGTVYAFKVSVYTDETGNTPVDSFIWNNVNPGLSTTKDVFVRNDAGSLPMTLTITTDDCVAQVGTPPVTNTSDIGMTITWNITSYPLTAGSGVWVQMTLAVPDNTETVKGLTFDLPINFIGDNP